MTQKFQHFGSTSYSKHIHAHLWVVDMSSPTSIKHPSQSTRLRKALGPAFAAQRAASSCAETGSGSLLVNVQSPANLANLVSILLTVLAFAFLSIIGGSRFTYLFLLLPKFHDSSCFSKVFTRCFSQSFRGFPSFSQDFHHFPIIFPRFFPRFFPPSVGACPAGSPPISPWTASVGGQSPGAARAISATAAAAGASDGTRRGPGMYKKWVKDGLGSRKIGLGFDDDDDDDDDDDEI